MVHAPGVDPGLEAFGRPLAEWRRFPEYVIQDGRIRPASHTDHERYDPWRAYGTARSGWGGRGGPAPYESLLELVWSLGLSPLTAERIGALAPAGERAVLAWCTEHGLLGLLSHETEAAYLAPRWERLGDLPGSQGTEDVLVVERTSYAWGPLGWQGTYDVAPAERIPISASTSTLRYAPAPRELWPPAWLPPRVFGRSLIDGAWTVRSVAEAWGPYFHELTPDRLDTHHYPVPLDFYFWYEYAEPVDAFLRAAGLFADAVRELGRPRGEGEYPSARGDEWAAANRAFHRLLAGALPAMTHTHEGFERAWRPRSLLASFAVMASLDLTAGMKVLACDVCGKPFVSAAYQARYCSPRCRQTATQRAYRRRRRGRDDPAAADDLSREAERNEPIA